MIVSYARCETCGHQVPGDTHPTTWRRVIHDEDERGYCSRECLEGSVRPLHQVYGLDSLDIQIIRLVASGYQDKQIGRALKRALSTIKYRLSVINLKLGAASRMQLILRAHSLGLIDLHTMAMDFAAQNRFRAAA